MPVMHHRLGGRSPREEGQKVSTCPGYDDNGDPMACTGTPGTPWTPVWCLACDTRRRARLSIQFDQLLADVERRANG